MNEKEIEKKADKLLKKYQPDSSQGVDVIEIAKKLGFIVGNINLDENEDGFILANKKKAFFGIGSKKIIALNSKRTPEEKMFTIAHELGHYIFEKNRYQIVYSHREHKKRDDHGPNYEYENKIDYFAACLLMPRKSFIDRYESLKLIYKDDTDSIVSELSDIFGVSLKSVRRRFDELGVKI